MGVEVISLTPATESAAEEALCEAIVDLAFVPAAPLNTVPAAYSAAVTYAKGAYVSEGGIYYRSQQAGNKAHEPKADADFEWWAPVSLTFVPLQNPDFGKTSFVSGG